MRAWKTVLLLLVFLKTAVWAQVQPNYVRTTVFNVDGNNNHAVSISYTDGLGRPIQSAVKLDENRDLVTSTFYDNAGRAQYVTNPFVNSTNSGSFLNRNFADLNKENSPLWGQYSEFADENGNPKAFSEIQYYNDPLSRVRKRGAPGKEYDIKSGNYSAMWYFGVGREDRTISLDGEQMSFKNGFIHSGLNRNALDLLYAQLFTEPFEPVTHLLTVARNPDGNFTQELKDGLGNTVAVWSKPGNHPDSVIIAEYEYDILGRVLVERAPKDRSGTEPEQLIADTRYIYNTLGQVIVKVTPDGSVEEFKYNPAGQLDTVTTWCSEKDNENREKLREIEHYYDNLGRLTKIEANGKEVQRNFYDNVEALNDLRKLVRLPANIRNELKNLRGRLVASIAINRIDGVEYYVADLFGYNNEGLIDIKVKIIPGSPAPQILRYVYDIHGKVTEETFTCGPDKVVREFNYDNMGRLKSVVHVDNNNRELVNYSYTDLGQMNEKTLGIQYAFPVEYQFNIRGWLTGISAVKAGTGFTQNISYEGLYTGNISSSEFSYSGNSSLFEYTQQYEYDKVNRLRGVASNGNSDFAGEFRYDAAGRFTFKEEGDSRLDQYEYFNNTSRLIKAKSENIDYTYDNFGNMVIDRSKKMIIEYDWRDMPVRFLFFKDIPGTDKISFDERGTYSITDDSHNTQNLVEYMEALSKADSENYGLLSTVVMVYDTNGSRVLKIGE